MGVVVRRSDVESTRVEDASPVRDIPERRRDDVPGIGQAVHARDFITVVGGDG